MKTLLILLLLLIGFTTQAQIELLKDSKSGKWGFIDENGEWVIQPQFEAGEDFYDYNFTFVKKGGKWGLIDVKGEVVLPFVYEKPGYAEYDDDMIPVAKSKKHGMVNKKTGTEIISCIYDKKLAFQENFYWSSRMLLLAIKENKAGLIDSAGTVIIKLAYDNSEEPFMAIETALKSGTILASQNKRKGLIDNAGNLLVPFQYDEVNVREFPDTLLFDIKTKGKHGIYSVGLKKELVAPVYDSPIFFEDANLAIVSRKKKFGLIDRQGKEVMPCTGTFTEAYEAIDKLTKQE